MDKKRENQGFVILEREVKETCKERLLFEGMDREFLEKATGVFWEAPKDRVLQNWALHSEIS